MAARGGGAAGCGAAAGGGSDEGGADVVGDVEVLGANSGRLHEYATLSVVFYACDSLSSPRVLDDSVARACVDLFLSVMAKADAEARVLALASEKKWDEVIRVGPGSGAGGGSPGAEQPGVAALRRALEARSVQLGKGSLVFKVFDRPREDALAIGHLLDKHGELFAAVVSATWREAQLRPVFVAVAPKLRLEFDVGPFEPRAESTKMTVKNTRVDLFELRKPHKTGRYDAEVLWNGIVRYFADTHGGRVPLVRVLHLRPIDWLDLARLVRNSREWARSARDRVVEQLGVRPSVMETCSLRLPHECFVVFAWDPEAFEIAREIVLSFCRRTRLHLRSRPAPRPAVRGVGSGSASGGGSSDSPRPAPHLPVLQVLRHRRPLSPGRSASEEIGPEDALSESETEGLLSAADVSKGTVGPPSSSGPCCIA